MLGRNTLSCLWQSQSVPEIQTLGPFSHPGVCICGLWCHMPQMNIFNYLLDLHKKKKLQVHEHLKKKKYRFIWRLSNHTGKYLWERLPRYVERGAATESIRASAVSSAASLLDRGTGGSKHAFHQEKKMKREGETRTFMCSQSMLREKQD